MRFTPKRMYQSPLVEIEILTVEVQCKGNLGL